MSDLPPDPPRLRAILEHLERQVAETETIGIYLRLQRDEVRKALARATSAPTRAQARTPQRPEPPRRTTPAEYLMESKFGPDDPLPVVVHVGACTIRQGRRAPSAISAQQARMVLTDTVIGAEPCPICRPENTLGIDLA
ncbi:hypothetical protein SAMN04490357_0244 [Streptomyces misionensis]|uniref:Uncharacterized protein n=1 Tax=Streptomyces misionensis TaxID=67331 RepID=A0A1H4IDE8_9ACTN|nr:DUF6233 domain-containing protein [Streptomyces misionensis]SEB32061.1 hypothetical protein SAMN04490357_0244 [Streptomyces misionensis]